MYLIDRYTIEDPDFSNVFCTDCHIELNKKINDNRYDLVPKVDHYDPVQSEYLRSSLNCEYRICIVAKMTGLAYQKKRKTCCSKEDDSPKCYKVCCNCFQ